MTETLKECPNPWCNEKRRMARVRDIPAPTFRVICGCGVMGPMMLVEAEAITAWNTRPREAALEAEVERLRVALKDCADDLEAEILARANSELPRRIDRDLETVRVARQALSPNNPAGQAMEGDHG